MYRDKIESKVFQNFRLSNQGIPWELITCREYYGREIFYGPSVFYLSRSTKFYFGVETCQALIELEDNTLIKTIKPFGVLFL